MTDTATVVENTTFVIDLDCGGPGNPDIGTDICQFKKDEGKPVEFTMTYSFSTDIVQLAGDQDDRKRDVATTGSDTDGTVFIVVTGKKGKNVLFEGFVNEGESFTFDNGGRKFDSETHVMIYDDQGGALIQDIEFHTSCSQPLAIGDQFGSVTLASSTHETGFTVGAPTGSGDSGVTYALTGTDAALFTIDPDTGVVEFIDAPDFENPRDGGSPVTIGGDNKYEITILATRDSDGFTSEKPLTVTIADECIKLVEGVDQCIIDLDCGEGENPDTGTDLCILKDTEGKPVSMTLVFDFATDINQIGPMGDQDPDKVNVSTFGSDPNGPALIRVLDKDGDVMFEGVVDEGSSFTFDNGGDKFSSETHVEIYSADGSTLLQAIEFHTSCSQPLAIGDQFGSVTLSGATLEEGRVLGGDGAPGDENVTYEITGGADFILASDNVVAIDPNTGELCFTEGPPDFETLMGAFGKNQFELEITATNTLTGETEIKIVEFCIEDDCIKVLEGTTFVVDLDAEGTGPRDIEIENASFEADSLGNGDYSYSISGWDVNSGGTWDPTSKDFDNGPTDGENVAWIYGKNGSISQTLNETYDSDATYEFSLDIGDYDGKNGDEDFQVQLLAGGTVIASTFGNSGKNDDLDTFTVSTAGFSDASLDGQALTIRVLSEDKGEFIVDNVRGTVEGASGDAGVTYAIDPDVPGDDAALFTVDPATGVVSFIDPPDFENPASSNGDNKYYVNVRATRDDGTFETQEVEVCVEDDPDGLEFCIEENTTPVIDLNVELACPVQEDVGTDLCILKDTEGKPTALELTFAFAEGVEQIGPMGVQADGKFGVDTFGGADSDGEYFIRVVDKNGSAIFEGVVSEGGTFLVDNGEKFSSETHVEVYGQQGGSLIQAIEFHTSCSQPLAIGDRFGSVTITGATLESGNSVGGFTTEVANEGNGGLVYTIVGGADRDLFTVDPATGEVSFINAPDFENPLDANGDNIYDVVVRATAINDPDWFEDESIEVCVEDVPETGSIAGRYFCDENANGIDDNESEPGIEGVTVELIDQSTGNIILTGATGPDGGYRFDVVPEGTYTVRFIEAASEKDLVIANVGTNDEIDSDAVEVAGPPGALTSEIAGVLVTAGTLNDHNDAGVAFPPDPDPIIDALDDVITVTEDETFGDLETLDGGAGSILDNDIGQDAGPYAGDVVMVNGLTANVGAWIQLFDGANSAGRVMINDDGTVDFDADGNGDGISDFDALNDGESDSVSLVYSIEEDVVVDPGGLPPRVATVDSSATVTINITGISDPEFDLSGDITTAGDQSVTFIIDHSFDTMQSAATGGGVVDFNGDTQLTRIDDFLSEIIAAAAGMAADQEIDILLMGRDVVETGTIANPLEPNVPLRGHVSTTAGDLASGSLSDLQSILAPLAPEFGRESELDIGLALAEARDVITEGGTKPEGESTDTIIILTSTDGVEDYSTVNFDRNGDLIDDLFFNENYQLFATGFGDNSGISGVEDVEESAELAALGPAGVDADIHVVLVDPTGLLDTTILDAIDADGVQAVASGAGPFGLDTLIAPPTELAQVVGVTVDGTFILAADNDLGTDGFQFDLVDLPVDPGNGVFVELSTDANPFTIEQSVEVTALLVENPADTFSFQLDLNDHL